ncbi:MAG: hypothetical protein R3195_17505 [Gemmatimonadota bacterium]|nr:hypothetical protein [Gemmatimonadota bacterium]
MSGLATEEERRLLGVKVFHTLVWAFFAGCIVAIPVVAMQERLVAATVLCGVVMIEVAILAFNDWRCPLTPVAARYTPDRTPGFDIFLPERLARYNKEIFGGLYLAGVLFVLILWLARLRVG